MFPRCPFSTKVTWTKIFLTREHSFSTRGETIMTTDCFFAHLPTFRMNISNLAMNLKVLKKIAKNLRAERDRV